MEDKSIAGLLRLALQSHREGRLEEAAGLYRLVLAGVPEQPDALHYLGIALHQQGKDTRSLELLERAAARKPADSAIHCNLAEVYCGLGQLKQAEACCRRALKLRPEYPEALLNLAAVHFRAGQFAEAEKLSREALRLRERFASAELLLADALREQGKVRESLDAYECALKVEPNLWQAHANCGLLQIQCGEMECGLAHCRRAVELAPEVVLPQVNLGRVLLANGRIDEAMHVLGDALRCDPNSSALCLALGAAWFELADYEEAGRWFTRALTLAPALNEARCSLGNLELARGDANSAVEVFECVLHKDAGCVEALDGLARAHLEQSDVDASVASYRKALLLHPESAALHAALGYTLSTAGDLAGAVDCQRRAIALNANSVTGYAGLLTTLGAKATAEERLRAEQLLTRPWLNEDERASLHFGLAHAYDANGDWNHAAGHMTAGNALKRHYREERGMIYDPQAHTAFVDALIANFTPAFFERVCGLGSASERPVFIVGMPRSGTTLVEQILASHPAVYGAGERPFAGQSYRRIMQTPPGDACKLDGPSLEAAANWHLEQLRSLDGGRAQRIVDKMPENYLWLGFLAAVFPRARFIHCRRDPRDVALSCWITNFTRLYWAFDLEHLAHRIQEYERLMGYWHGVLPVPVLNVDYEELTADQEGVSRRLVAWLGLEWDERCLDFYRTKRLVKTASVTQVRQPIYRRSVARWKHYEAMLCPLLRRFGEIENNDLL